MKTLKLLALGSVLFGAAQVTHGSVLLGFNSFNADTSDINGTDVDITPDEAKTGWSGSVTSDLAVNGGSTDRFYGSDWDQPSIGHLIYGAPPITDNGYVDNGNITLFKGVAGTSGAITALLFDAVSSANSGSTFNIKWQFWTDISATTPIPGGSGTSSTYTLASGTTAKNDSNYQDFAVDLGSFFLPAGGYFEIVWDRLSGQSSFKLDNIALVPEPGSMLGLGCLVGFGTLLRSRRRSGPAVIA
jgi:hypothetical protein